MKLILTTTLFAASGLAAVPFAGGDAFIQKNCAPCRNSSAPAAQLDFNKLGYEGANRIISPPG